MKGSITHALIFSLAILVASTTLSERKAVAQAGAVRNILTDPITAKIDTVAWKLTPTWGVEYKPVLLKAWEAAGERMDHSHPALLALRASGIVVFVKKAERLNVLAFHVLKEFAIIEKAGGKWVMLQQQMNVPKIPKPPGW